MLSDDGGSRRAAYKGTGELLNCPNVAGSFCTGRHQQTKKRKQSQSSKKLSVNQATDKGLMPPKDHAQRTPETFTEVKELQYCLQEVPSRPLLEQTEKDCIPGLYTEEKTEEQGTCKEERTTSASWDAGDAVEQSTEEPAGDVPQLSGKSASAGALRTGLSKLAVHRPDASRAGHTQARLSERGEKSRDIT